MARRFNAVFLLVLMIQSGISSASRDGDCVRVPKMCYKLISENYTHMRLPNMLNHTRKEDVADDLSLWNRLLQSKQCNAGNQLKYFLCFTYAPVCVDSKSTNKLIPPCRSMCQSVRRACEPVMQKHNYSWPQVFNCDQERRFFDDATQMCISMKILQGIQNTKKTPSQDNRCSCKKEYKTNRLRTMICRNDFVFRGRLVEKPKAVNSGSGQLEVKMKALRVLRGSKGNQASAVRIGATLNLTLYNEKKNCRCRRLRMKKRSRGSGQYFVIGRSHRGRLEVAAIAKWKDISHSLKKARQC